MNSRKQQRPNYLVLFIVTCLTCNFAFAALPKVDFDRMGTVGLAGSFVGLDYFNNASYSFDPSTSTLFSRGSDGSLSPIASTNKDGRIFAGCVLNDVFYLGGSFNSIGSTSAHNIASYNPSSGAFSPLAQGLDGEVDSIYCDKSGNIWVGGAFHGPVSASKSNDYKGAVAIFNVKGSSWSPPPFGGLAGAAGRVQSITANPTGSSLFFAGSFMTAFKSNTSTTIPNNPNNPNVPFSVGATPFSSSLVPISLDGAGSQIDASPADSRSEFSNIFNILCPAGPDGPRNTWLARDGSVAKITARTFEFSTASGLRLGNTFVEGRGTTTFNVLTIPDNQPLTFNYVDPQTLRNQTCSGSCPLSTNSSVPYQDFLFDGVSKSLTGLQIILSGWQGAGPGLHLLQLLSSGAFASAVSDQNHESCFAPASSQVFTSGDWATKMVTTSIAGTTQPVLASSVNVGTSSESGPSLTWKAYISAAGEYDVNILIPGCTNLQDCGERTSVKVTVSPGGGLSPVVSTISQAVTEDTSSGIYRGPMFPTGADFQTTITLQLADQPTGNGQDGKFELVADRIQLVLVSVNTTATLSSGANGAANGVGAQRGFGFFEWNLKQQGTMDATNVIATSDKTTNDALGPQLFSALGNKTTSTVPFTVNAVAAHHSGAIFIGGEFTFSSGPSNIAVFKDNSLSPLANGGLNGVVNGLALDGDDLYIGGAFSDTPSKTSNGAFRGVVRYDIQKNNWNALMAGVNGAITNINIVNGKLDVAGSFTELLLSPNSASGVAASGFASWDIGNGTWVNPGGFLMGSMTFVANGSGSTSEFLAGNVIASRQFGADGFVTVSNTRRNDGAPTIKPLNVHLDTSVSSTSIQQRSDIDRRAPWLGPIALPRLFARQESTKLAPLPAFAPAPAPAVLAGAFWTNSSSSSEVVVLGGNFSLPSSGASQSQGVIFYDAAGGNAKALVGPQPNGVIRALKVSGNALFVGGRFTIPGTQANSLAMYDLAKQQWDNSIQPLQGPSVSVRSITVPPSKSTVVVVAGTFNSAGSLPCQGICQFDTTSKQWNRLGPGITGEVSSVAYTSNSQILVAAGSIVLSDGTPANVAAYNLVNNTWAAVGPSSQIPGPVTACAMNNGNFSNMFAAGSSSDGSSPFFMHWNGVAWTNLGTIFRDTTKVSQLSMVPLQDTHSSGGMIESDRMLFITGSLASDTFGNASAALYDGQNIYPYIVSTSPSGGPGFVSQLFYSLPSFSFVQHHFLPIGVVILISIAIATGIVFLLLLLGILWTLFSRRDHNNFVDHPEYEEEDNLHRPSSLLAHINAATRGTIIGTGAESTESSGKPDDPHAAVASPGSGTYAEDDAAAPYIRATDTPVDAAHGTLQYEGETARPTYVRYTFEGDGEGELPVTAGAQVLVLDDRDAAWWYVRDPNTGREGVIPASYLY